MKKRALSVLLTVVMILSMLPAAALAANGSDMPVLRMHVMEEVDGVWTEQFVTDGGEWALNDRWAAEFYLHYPNSSPVRVAPEDLSLPRSLNMKILKAGELCQLEVVGTGSGQIAYTDANGQRYGMDMDFLLPHLGVYSDMPFDLSTLMEDVVLDEDNESFYIALCPEFAARGSKMTQVFLQDGRKNLSEVSDIKISADGDYAEVTITDPTARDSHFFGVEVENDQGGPCGNWGMSFRIINDMPGLYCCYVNREDDKWWVNTDGVNEQLWNNPGNEHWICFYYGTREEVEAGTAELISMEELTFPAYLDVKELTDEWPAAPEGALWIEATRFAKQGDVTDVVYERGGKEYTLPAQVLLPDVAFYSEPVAKESTYIYEGNPFTVTGDANTIYLCARDTEAIRVGDVQRWYTPAAGDCFTITPSVDGNGRKDGRYLAFTLKEDAPFPGAEIGVQVEVQRYNQREDIWETNNHGIWASLVNDKPGLMARYMEWDDDLDGWYECLDNELMYSLSLEAGNESPMQFYYGTVDDYEKVELSQLDIPADIMRAYVRDGATWVEGTCFQGSGVISYPDEDVRMQVKVVQPDFGFYSAPTASASTYLGDEVEISRAGDTFYVIADQRRTILGIDSIRYSNTNGDMTDHFDVTVAKDGSYAAITAKQDAEGKLPMGGDYRVDVIRDRGIRYLHIALNRVDLPRLAVPTDLNWNRDYEWNSARYVERMGSMSFYGDNPTQNRYDLEVYSAADNYTSPVIFGNWHFGDRETDRYYSAQDFIYDDPDSGTYRFRVKARGDGVNYRDSEWSELSDAWTYTAPAEQLDMVDETTMKWTRWDGRYAASWAPVEQDGVGYYEVWYYYRDMDTGRIERIGGTFDIPAHGGWNMQNGAFMEPIHDEIIEECGNVPYYFKVRAIPVDMTEYRMSPFTAFSLPLDTEKVTDMVNDKLDSLVPDVSSGQTVTVEQVQQALAQDTADLRTAMAADQSVSGGPNSGTIDKIKELEQTVSNNVTQKVEAKGSAPQEIKDIANDIQMVGATLNWEDKHPEQGTPVDVTLVIEQPKNGTVIPEIQHNAVQFSMKLHGAIDKDDRQAGQQLIVPIVIDMPVPAGINPDFLVVLHKLDNGDIEQLWPHIYWDEAKGQHRATFVIDSFSDFALVEYDFRFPVQQVNKMVGDAPFVVAAIDNADGSRITYSSSDPSVAEVNAVTGQVEIKRAGTVTITAVASATELYPEVQAEYTLVVTARPSYVPDEDYDDDDDSGYVPPVVKEEPPKETFADVSSEAWYYEAVQYVYDHDIMAGVGDNSFAPESELTRAMVAQVLFNMDENGYTDAASVFNDVVAGEWYVDAINWAAAEGVMSGYGGGQFGTMDSVTREQLAMTLYNYAVSKGYPIEGKIVLGMYTDAGDVSTWAVNAVEWALANGILRSDNGVLQPGACASRAQVALALMNFCENVIK